MSGNLCPWQGRQKPCRGQRKWVLLLALDFDWVLSSGYKHRSVHLCLYACYTSIIKLTQITFFKSNHEVKAWSCRPYILEVVFISAKVLTWINLITLSIEQKKRKTKIIYRKLMNNLVWQRFLSFQKEEKGKLRVVPFELRSTVEWQSLLHSVPNLINSNWVSTTWDWNHQTNLQLTLIFLMHSASAQHIYKHLVCVSSHSTQTHICV